MTDTAIVAGFDVIGAFAGGDRTVVAGFTHTVCGLRVIERKHQWYPVEHGMTCFTGACCEWVSVRLASGVEVVVTEDAIVGSG